MDYLGVRGSKPRSPWRRHPAHSGQVPCGLRHDESDLVFEIHPVTELAGIDVKSTLHPIHGYEPKGTEQAFTVYERTQSRITPMKGNKVKIETPMAGMNYVKFEMELNEKALPVKDGRMAFAKVLDEQSELVARKRRMVFVKDTPPEIAIRDKSAGDCLVVLGIPRVNLTLVDWRVKHSKERPEVLNWSLPYEIVVVGVYDEECHESD